MILSYQQIYHIIRDNPNKKLVKAGKDKNKKLRLHMYGEGLKTELTKIDGFENEKLLQVRQKYSKSNTDLFERLGRPIDKVFSARGGSVYYNLSSTKDKEISLLAGTITPGYSVKTWIETFWKQHFLDDPCGLIFMEIDKDGKVYPTYKSITTIFDYQPKGSGFDYVIFELNAEDKKALVPDVDGRVFRIVDDAEDALYTLSNEDLKKIPGQAYINYFKMVPAILNSDFVDSKQAGSVDSLYSPVIELADDYLNTGSVRNLSKIRHGFPKYYEYADECPVCAGTGKLNAEDCPACKGSGRTAMLNPGDSKLLETPMSKDDPVITPNVAGFIAFPKDYFDMSSQELVSLEGLMTFTLWGRNATIKTQGTSTSNNSDTGTYNTATEAILDVKPEEARLFPVSAMAEKRHKFIIDCLVKIKVTEAYSGASVNYGRRYILESADTLWEKYAEARKTGAAVNLLDELLIEYINSKYVGDEVGAEIATKAMRVEPFVHYTISEVKSFGVSGPDFLAKLYFGEWYQTMNDASLLSGSLDQLRESLYKFVAGKNIVATNLVN